MSAKKKTNKPHEAVLIIGSGFGALKVAEDLAQSGIPVMWTTKAGNFLELPGGIESFIEWPDDINFQFRPLYLRVTRNPHVKAMTRARVDSLERSGNRFRAVVVQDPHYVDYDLCTGCGRCMEICPLDGATNPPLKRSPAYCPSRALELDKRQLSACRAGCPLGINVQAYMALTAASRFEEALRIIKEDNPLPGICGRVCHHPCEESCRRSDLDQAVAIRDIKRFLADYEAEHGLPELVMPERPKQTERIAVIGSGPAGLTAAHFLNRFGFSVTVFESFPYAGGMLRAGINSFRLPRRVLDAEIQAIERAGVEIRTGVTVNSVEDLLARGYDAVLVSTGAHRDLRLNIPGEDAGGIVHCVQFLSGVSLYNTGEVGPRTVVIGAGNSAMDAARTALRLGADDVTIVAIEKEHEMPAHPREVREAREEGVEFILGVAPIAFETEENRVRRVVCRPARWSEPDSRGTRRIEYDSEQTFTVDADTVIVAIGQQPHLEESGLGGRLATGRGGRIAVDECSATSIKGIFAAGDVVTGPSTVIGSMAAGRRAAGKIIEYLTGQPSPFVDLACETRGVGDFIEISEDIPRQWRPEMAQRQPKARRRDFDEVDFGFTVDQAVFEARRCLQCGVCCECRVCETACAEIGAIDHFRPPRRFELSSPAVVVADSNELPELDCAGEGIYNIGEFKQTVDMMDVLVSGSAAAGQAMARAAFLRELVPQEKPRSIEMDANGGLGVFFCSCNGTMAPQSVLDRLLDTTQKIPAVRHSEVILSACHPDGSDRIARAVQQKRLGRVILASCVCCPLEFQCISCNDQRTRARIHLFDRLGLPRSHFETINIRDHLADAGLSEEEMLEGARSLLRGAMVRSHLMTPLRQGTTEIGRHILILGGSETGISCALNLGLQGFKVRLAHRCKIQGEDTPEYVRNRPVDVTQGGRSITHVEEAEILDISGHVGDFRILVNEGGKRHRWRADVICLTDENVLPLAIPEDMMGLKKLYRYDFAFFHTPQLGLYRVLPRTLKRVNAFEAGAALAAQVATATAEAFLKDHELSPRVDPELCRGCGRCADICPFNAIHLVADSHGIYKSEVLRHNCVGCGGCVGRCPVTAMNIPYFSNKLLEEIVMETLSGERRHEPS